MRLGRRCPYFTSSIECHTEGSGIHTILKKVRCRKCNLPLFLGYIYTRSRGDFLAEYGLRKTPSKHSLRKNGILSKREGGAKYLTVFSDG